MSDLSLLAAALARVTAADQPDVSQSELPVVLGLSARSKHRAVQPVALELHQASIETYQAEFSRGAFGSPASARGIAHHSGSSRSGSPSSADSLSNGDSLGSDDFQKRGDSAGINLAEAIPSILPEPVKLSLRPILTREGGSIAALAPSIRPIALKLHQASIETYATTLALAAPANPIAAVQSNPVTQSRVMIRSGEVQSDAVTQPVATAAPSFIRSQADSNPDPAQPSPAAVNRASLSQSASSRLSPADPSPKISTHRSQSITLTASADLSPAALALGMAQAAGLAETMDVQAEEAAQTALPPANSFSDVASLLASPPLDALGTSPNSSMTAKPAAAKPSAAQAAIALDREVRARLDQDASQNRNQARSVSATQAPLWASPNFDSSGTIVQLSPETVARAQAAPGAAVSTEPSLQPTIALQPNEKQAIAVAPSNLRGSAQPSLSPFQLPQPKPQAGPRSGPQLYQQRLAALKQGRLYSRLPIDSFKAIWQGVRHKPSYGQWKRLLAAEARAAGRGQGNNRLSIVLGDSISLWLPMQQLPSSQLWLNQGISGDTTAGILKRLDPLKDTSPSNIYVMAGVNDLKNGATDDQVAQNIQQIMRRLRQQHPQAQIHVQSILPASIGLPPGRIQRLNSRIAYIAKSEQVAFLNIYPQFAAPNGQMMAQLTTDGIHLSPQGYALWQSILHRMVEPWAFANRGGELGRS